MSRRRFDFIDWMKCLGILAIVYGHVGAATIDWLFWPIYPKQLGVAFFVFAMGHSLALERRPVWRVVYNRLFEVCLFGILFALLMSGIALWQRGTLALSNYEPFVLGVNVLFDHFPANPTTWYIGTYLHILLLWALGLRRLRVRAWMIPAWMACEIGLRMALLSRAGMYVAYMAAPNWGTVFLLGTLCGQKAIGDIRKTPVPAWLAVATLAALWYVVLPAPLETTFPFKRLAADPELNRLSTSLSVTTLYSAYTWLIFEASRRTAAPAWVRLVARNTLIVFIAHMPLYFGLQEAVADQPAVVRLTVELLVCGVGLMIASEIVHRAVEIPQLRERLAAQLGWRSRSNQVTFAET